jgi:hypothetical protein
LTDVNNAVRVKISFPLNMYSIVGLLEHIVLHLIF